MAKDALGAHARDELGISEVVSARPIQAALTSAATFASGAALPLLTAILAPHAVLAPAVFATSLFFLGFSARSARASAVPTYGSQRCASLSGAPSRWASRPASARSSAKRCDNP